MAAVVRRSQLGALGPLALAAVVAGGCYSPSLADCAYACDSTAQCPDSTTCDVGQHACRLAGATGTCGTGIDASTIDASSIDASPVKTDAPTLFGPWKILQSAEGESSVTLSPTAGDTTLIVAGQFSQTGLLNVTDDSGDTFTRIAGSTAIFDGQGSPGVEIWFASRTKASTTTVNALGPGTGTFATVVWEVSGLAGDNSFQQAASLSNQPATTNPTSPPLTTTEQGELIITATDFATGEKDIAAGFTEDTAIEGDGWAHLTSPDEPPGTYQATWTLQSPGACCATAVAFVVGPP